MDFLKFKLEVLLKGDRQWELSNVCTVSFTLIHQSHSK